MTISPSFPAWDSLPLRVQAWRNLSATLPGNRMHVRAGWELDRIEATVRNRQRIYLYEKARRNRLKVYADKQAKRHSRGLRLMERAG